MEVGGVGVAGLPGAASDGCRGLDRGAGEPEPLLVALPRGLASPVPDPAQMDGEILAWGRPADFPGRERAAEVRANGEPRTCLQQCQL